MVAPIGADVVVFLEAHYLRTDSFFGPTDSCGHRSCSRPEIDVTLFNNHPKKVSTNLVPTFTKRLFYLSTNFFTFLPSWY